MSSFNVLGGPKQLGTPLTELPEGWQKNWPSNSDEAFKSLLNSAQVMLFMKGTPNEPRCGFSANVVALLNHYGREFQSFDILSDENVRQGLKNYSQWPTYPQLYVKGELVGGNDVLMEMHQNGELEKLLAQ